MVIRKRTFGESLSHFVRSIDIVDTTTKENVLSVIEGYLKDELNIRFFNFYVEGTINQKVGLLQTNWGRGASSRDSFSIKNDEGNYQGQVSLAYDRESLLWITAPNKSPLRSAKSYIDLSSRVESSEIPEYVERTEHEILTSIIRPVRDDDKIYGVVDFESVSYLDYSPHIAEELKKISVSISTLYLLNKVYENQRRNTKREIDYLAELRNSRDDLLHLAKPKIFVAFSSRAEPDVISSIRRVLDKYEKKVEPVFWDRISDSGVVTQHILREIRSCRYGVCYFSEPADDTATGYQDNDNVLIEAGMLTATSHEYNFSNWIPIREEESGKLPFDFSGNRVIFVNRLSSGELNTEEFESELKSMLKQWQEFED